MLRVDVSIVQIVEQFFDVERIALRPLTNLSDERLREPRLFSVNLSQFERNQLLNLFRREIIQWDLGEMW